MRHALRAASGLAGAAAVVVAQRLVDEHLIWHAVSDQPFKDSSAPFRFVTPRVRSSCHGQGRWCGRRWLILVAVAVVEARRRQIYNVWLQIKDPDTGLHQYLVRRLP